MYHVFYFQREFLEPALGNNVLSFPLLSFRNRFAASASLVADELSPRFLSLWYPGAPLWQLHEAQLLLCATTCNVGQVGFSHSISSSIKTKTMVEADFEIMNSSLL